MSRPRINDPLDVSDNPGNVIEINRDSDIWHELQIKICHVQSSYAMAMIIVEGGSLNESIARLKRAVARKTLSRTAQSELHPEVSLVVSAHARRRARERTGDAYADPSQQDIMEAAWIAAEQLDLQRGRPTKATLRHCTIGLMALIQEYTGKPVLAYRTTGGNFAPRFVGAGKIIPDLFQSIDPSITEGELAIIVNKARVEYAGKAMRFEDFFPGYGIAFENLKPGALLANGSRIEAFELVNPIYCSN